MSPRVCLRGAAGKVALRVDRDIAGIVMKSGTMRGFHNAHACNAAALFYARSVRLFRGFAATLCPAVHADNGRRE